MKEILGLILLSCLCIAAAFTGLVWFALSWASGKNEDEFDEYESSKPPLTVFEFIEDFDNSELSPKDWADQMYEAVQVYNDKYDTNHHPLHTVTEYRRRQSNLTEK